MVPICAGKFISSTFTPAMDSQQSTPSAPTAPPPEAFPEAGTSAEALIAAAEAARQPSVPGRGALGVHEPFVRSFVRSTCDWPRRGITFLDISPLLAETRAFRTCVDALVERYVDSDITHVAGVDARGFTIGTACTYLISILLSLLSRKKRTKEKLKERKRKAIRQFVLPSPHLPPCCAMHS